MISHVIPSSAFRRLTRERLGLAISGVALASAAGTAILLYAYQLMFFAFVAYGFALIFVAWIRKIWTTRPVATPASLEYSARHLSWRHGTIRLAGAMRVVFAHRDHLLLYFGTSDACEVPLRGAAASELTAQLERDGVEVHRMEGPFEIIGILALAGLGMLAWVVITGLWVRAVTYGLLGALAREWPLVGVMALASVPIVVWGGRRGDRSA